ncbi:MAG: hypothetical protein IJ717_07750 [Treponema sp.]|nr:hypothetical protein [Treponema sp.]
MSTKSEPSFLQKIFDALFNKSDPEVIKRKKLKQIAKNLSKTKFKFYKSSTDQILPAFAKFFYEVYKVISPCQYAFNNQQNPNAYKMMVIEYLLSENQKKVLDELSEESIKTFSASLSVEQLKQKVKDHMKVIVSEIDKKKIEEIDNLYTKLLAFKQFCSFDFYFLLKKFDSSLTEGDFSKAPKFNTVDASYLADDLQNFMSIAWGLPLDEEWDDLMKMYKATRGAEPLKPTTWNKIVNRLKQLRSAGTFEMMAQLIMKDPLFEVKVESKKENIAESYIEKIKTQAQLAIRKLEAEMKNSKIDSIAAQIFKTTSISSTKFYTEAASENFVKKGLTGYMYAKPLNYMKAFLVEFVKKEVREYADLVLIRGKWTTQELSQQMSNAYNSIMEHSTAIIEFDGKFNENDGMYGQKLKNLLPKIDRDKESKNVAITTLRDCNAVAKELVVVTTKDLVSFAKSTKSLIEDHKKGRPELISNWKELERFAETPINDLAVDIYKKTALLVTLMQNLLK